MMAAKAKTKQRELSSETTTHDCQSILWESLQELDSYSMLFRSLEATEIKTEKLYGVGLALGRITASLEKIHDKIGQA